MSEIKNVGYRPGWPSVTSWHLSPLKGWHYHQACSCLPNSRLRSRRRSDVAFWTQRRSCRTIVDKVDDRTRTWFSSSERSAKGLHATHHRRQLGCLLHLADDTSLLFSRRTVDDRANSWSIGGAGLFGHEVYEAWDNAVSDSVGRTRNSATWGVPWRRRYGGVLWCLLRVWQIMVETVTKLCCGYMWNKIITQRRSVAKSVGCFQRRLFVCVFVCQHDNFRTSKHGMMKLGGRCIVQEKSRPSSNSGVIAPALGAHGPQRCGVGLRRWENQRVLSSFEIM